MKIIKSEMVYTAKIIEFLMLTLTCSIHIVIVIVNFVDFYSPTIIHSAFSDTQRLPVLYEQPLLKNVRQHLHLIHFASKY